MEAHTRIGSGAPGTIWRQAKEFGFFTNKDILVIDQLIPVGKKEMSASAFLAGYKLTG
jgi:methionyl-tRNA formyltransferase